MASISSIANVKLFSKQNQSPLGFHISICDGALSEIIAHPIDAGTHIHIENLFYNTPARLNYIKTAKTEYAHILNFLQQVALAYPHI